MQRLGWIVEQNSLSVFWPLWEPRNLASGSKVLIKEHMGNIFNQEKEGCQNSRGFSWRNRKSFSSLFADWLLAVWLFCFLHSSRSNSSFVSHSGSPTVGKDPGVYVVVTTTEDAKKTLCCKQSLINPNQNESGALEVFINQHNGAGCRECIRLVIKLYVHGASIAYLQFFNQGKKFFFWSLLLSVLIILFPVAVICVSISIISD